MPGSMAGLLCRRALRLISTLVLSSVTWVSNISVCLAALSGFFHLRYLGIDAGTLSNFFGPEEMLSDTRDISGSNPSPVGGSGSSPYQITAMTLT